MAILNQFSAILLLFRFDSLFCFSLRNLWRFQARDSRNHAICDSRFCAAKAKTKAQTIAVI